jgi:antitoxin (DNA-binding transcriptional repressor) of toxin-antitoxin stability system
MSHPHHEAEPAEPLHPIRLRQVGVRAFRDRASQLLSSGDVLEIERHGRTIGFFIPVRSGDSAEARRALSELNEAVADVLASGLIDEETLARHLSRDESR